MKAVLDKHKTHPGLLRQPGSHGYVRILSQQDVELLAKQAISCHVGELLQIGQTDENAFNLLMRMAGTIVDWISYAVTAGIHGSNGSAPASDTYSVVDVASLEESIWCPSLGLKGKLDVVVSMRPSSQRHQHRGDGGTLCMPLELKTGKSKATQLIPHRAQVRALEKARRETVQVYRPSLTVLILHPCQVILYILILMLRDGRRSDGWQEDGSLPPKVVLGI